MSQREVESALVRLEELLRRGRRPGHHLAREVLLSLGQALRAEDAGAVAWLERARRASRTGGMPWEEAVRSELSLACGEFVQCVDPRYLDQQGYDLAYTRGARARLEDRLRAARELGFELAAREAELLGLADQVLGAHVERKTQSAGPPESTV